MSHYLRKIVNSVRKAGADSPQLMNFAIPDLWVSDSLKTPHIAVHDGHVLLNPYTFTVELIEKVFLTKPNQDLKPYFLSHEVEKKFSKGNWIKKSSVYSMMVRSSASFDHDRTGQLEDVNLNGLKDTGTFIKDLAYLPTLRRMGIDVLYLLPIAKYSL